VDSRRSARGRVGVGRRPPDEPDAPLPAGAVLARDRPSRASCPPPAPHRLAGRDSGAGAARARHPRGLAGSPPRVRAPGVPGVHRARDRGALRRSQTSRDVTAAREETLVLYSRLAFYPVHWLALEEIVRRFRARAVVLAAPSPELPSVHRALGSADPERAAGLPIEVRRAPAGSRRERLAWLARQLRAVRPDAIWVQEEPIDPFLLRIRALYRPGRSPRIVTAVCENIFPPPPAAEQIARRLLWPRLDGLIAVATASLEGIRAAGMAASVPAHTLVAGALEPKGA